MDPHGVCEKSLDFLGEGVQEYDRVVGRLLPGLSLAMDQLTCALSSLTDLLALYEVHFESLSTVRVSVQKEIKLLREASIDQANALVNQ